MRLCEGLESLQLVMSRLKRPFPCLGSLVPIALEVHHDCRLSISIGFTS